MTVQDVIDLIVSRIPGAPLAETVDTIKAGDASQPVTGVVTTFLATREVIAKAAEQGANLVITHEPVFYNHTDAVDWLQDDPVYQSKRRLIETHGIVVWRFHDYWHMHEPDGIMTGVLRALGWDAYADPAERNVYTIPETTLADLAAFLKQAFATERVHGVGLPEMPVRRVGLLPGASGGRSHIALLGRPGVDVLVVGEIHEWETSEYVRDAVHAGMRKALITVGHAPSEEPGMQWMADWLAPQLPGVKVIHIPAQDAIWSV